MHYQESIEYFDGAQRLVGELFYPQDQQASAGRPAILVFPAFEGRGEFALQYAQNFAEHGYLALAVDMYGDAVVAKTLDDCLRYIKPFLQDRSLVRRRALLAYAQLRQLQPAAGRPIAAIGFCFGGMCMLEIARSGEDLAAGVSVHGVLSRSDLPTAQIKTKLLILQGYRDPQVPPDSLQAFAQEMNAGNAPDWVFTYFSHAKHSFSDFRTGSFDALGEEKMGREYHRLAALRAFRYALDFFSEE